MGLASGKPLPEYVLEAPSLHEVPLSSGRQQLPDFSRPGSAAGLPLMKERALLQVQCTSNLSACCQICSVDLVGYIPPVGLCCHGSFPRTKERALLQVQCSSYVSARKQAIAKLDPEMCLLDQ